MSTGRRLCLPLKTARLCVKVSLSRHPAFYAVSLTLREGGMGIPLLELRDVTYALNGKRILEHVSWTVRQGEHWAILGANGAGKRAS